MADNVELKDGEAFWDDMPGATHRQNLNSMYDVWLAALEEAVGPRGWSPAFGIANDGARRVLQIVDWVGGEDVKPSITGYIGASGIVPTAAEAIDIRGQQGLAGDDGEDGADGPANVLTIGTVQSGPTADAQITGTSPAQTLNLTLPKGDDGDNGDDGTDGWTPVFTAVVDGERRVMRVDDWTGGQGSKPATGYIGASGIVASIGDAVDVRGAPGSGSVSSVNSVGPDGNGDVDIGIADIPGLGGALDDKVDKQSGYGLSQEDYTLAEKQKLAALESSRFKGEFVSLPALISGVPSPSVGDYANVDAGVGESVQRYSWDASDDEWVLSGSDAEPLTAAQVKQLYEDNPDTNAFTDLEKSKLGNLSAVATSGSYNDLDDRPSIPSVPDSATPAQIKALTSSNTVTPSVLATAASEPGTISGGTSNTFNWSAAVNYTMSLTGNRTLSNPTNVLPGTTRVIVVSSSTSTTRTLAFGSNFVGDLPTVSVTNVAHVVLFLYAVSATKIVVSGVEI